MKKWHCDDCNKELMVSDDYEPKYCCSGFGCGCYGLPVDPPLCVDCSEKHFGKSVK